MWERTNLRHSLVEHPATELHALPFSSIYSCSYLYFSVLCSPWLCSSFSENGDFGLKAFLFKDQALSAVTLPFKPVVYLFPCSALSPYLTPSHAPKDHCKMYFLVFGDFLLSVCHPFLVWFHDDWKKETVWCDSLKHVEVWFYNTKYDFSWAILHAHECEFYC